MVKENLTIRDYQEGDEKALADIFNEVMIQIDPNMPPTSSDEILIRQPTYGNLRNLEEFSPAHIKVLINPRGEIIGYSDCNSQQGIYTLQYPLILKKYRSKKTIDMLFRAIYDFAKNDNPKSVRVVYLDTYNEILDYFKHQQIAKIKTTRINKRVSIPVKKLNFQTSDYDIKKFTEEKIEELDKFRNSKEVVGGQISIKQMKDDIKRGYHSSLIYQSNRLLGWWSIRINSPPNDYDKKLDRPIGVLNNLLVDSSHKDTTGLRKALLKSGYEYLEKKQILEFRVWAVYNGSFYSECQDLGFKLTGESEIEYGFE